MNKGIARNSTHPKVKLWQIEEFKRKKKPGATTIIHITCVLLLHIIFFSIKSEIDKEEKAETHVHIKSH